MGEEVARKRIEKSIENRGRERTTKKGGHDCGGGGKIMTSKRVRTGGNPGGKKRGGRGGE